MKKFLDNKKLRDAINKDTLDDLINEFETTYQDKRQPKQSERLVSFLEDMEKEDNLAAGKKTTKKKG